jgi:hypothetical protein
LILEPQRTNVITNYNDFVTGASNVTTTANNATSPEGYQNADLITGDAGTATKVVNFNGASAGQYTISVFAKYNTQQWIQLGAGGIATYANFDIQNGVVGGTNGTATISDYGNGWYRCSLLLASGTPLSHYVGIVTASSSARLSTTASTGSFWAYGYQSELGTYATSIIPTNGTSVTRVADAASKTGISSLIGQTEGTLFIDFDPQDISSFGRYISIESASGAGGGWIGIFSEGTTPNVLRFYGDGFDIDGGLAPRGVRIKAALAYKNGVLTSAYVNGASVGTLTANTTGKSYENLKLSSAVIGNAGCANNFQTLVFKTALTNAQLAELTTL